MAVSSLSCYLCALAFLAGSVDEAVSIWSSSQRREALMKNGQEATAVVWGCHKATRRRMDFVQDCYVEVRYRLDNHTQRAAARATPAVYEKCADLKQVQIKYQPDRPGEVMVTGDSDPFGPRRIEAGGALIVAFGFVFLGRRAAYSGF